MSLSQYWQRVKNPSIYIIFGNNIKINLDFEIFDEI